MSEYTALGFMLTLALTTNNYTDCISCTSGSTTMEVFTVGSEETCHRLGKTFVSSIPQEEGRAKYYCKEIIKEKAK